MDTKNSIKTVGLMWINEDLGLYSIWNAAIMTDLYYEVVDKNFVPEFFQSANFDRSKDNLRGRIELH